MSGAETDLESILYFMDTTLGIPDFPDYDAAQNGLQVQGSRPVRKIGAAVDASVQTIDAAIAESIDLLIVHHGIFWGGLQPLTGRHYRRVAPLLKAGVGLYSAHLPLDAHPELGNCARLLGALGLEPKVRFGRFGGEDIGFEAVADEHRDGLLERMERVLGCPVRLIAGGPTHVKRIGVVTGAGGSFVGAAALAGLDTLVTGEASHHTYVDAMELGVNVILGGHYATETFGVRALAAFVGERFGVSWQFLDYPTGF